VAAGESKQAYLMTSAPVAGAPVAVVDAGGEAVLRGRTGASAGAWSAAFPAVYRLDLSRLTREGTFRVAVSGPDSDVIDGGLTKVGGPVDVAGGWFDAGDFLKFTNTAAYADLIMLFAQRGLEAGPGSAVAAEARHGLDWLGKMWDPATRTMYLQVGIGSGDSAGTFNGDHDIWRLPEQDDADTNPADLFAARQRPVFRAGPPGAPISPNLAGKFAAAFALAAQVDAAAHPERARAELATAAQVFGMARTADVGTLATAQPHGFYPESAWRDDLELRGAELALAGEALDDPRAAGWLRASAHWAGQYLATEAGRDTLNLFDVSALGHAELLRAMTAVDGPSGLEVTRPRLLGDLRAQIQIGRTRAKADPFGAGAVFDTFDADSHGFGLAATVRLYRAASGDRTFDAFGTQQRGWVLGANPWGVSMMIGEGSTFPVCPQHQVANLSGSLNGTRPVLVGAVVNGPNGSGQFAGGLGDLVTGMRQCPVGPGSRFAMFDGRGSSFVDDVRAFQTVEPALDMSGSALLAFALGAREG
jgi:hypothetical protein